MTIEIEKTFERLWTLAAGRFMVVSDLHGQWDLYVRYRDRFLKKRASGEVDGLIFLGDLVHRDKPDHPDQSIEIVANVMQLQQEFGNAIIYLCGNHELPHIYSFPLSKGEVEFTPDVEQALQTSGRREEIITFWRKLPFYLRSHAGVSLTHAGAFPGAGSAETMQRLFKWSHSGLLKAAGWVMKRYNKAALQQAVALLYGVDSYPDLAAYYLSATPDDPHYNHLVRGYIAMNGWTYELNSLINQLQEEEVVFNNDMQDSAAAAKERFTVLWDALFTRCEQQYSLTAYGHYVEALLSHLAVGYVPQLALVAGHMRINGSGHEIVGEKHLRLASGPHALPVEKGEYLLFNAAEPINSVAELLSGLESIFD